ncbi:glycosyltransferase family 4 protein [Mycobacteroides salmoniphilum]|uniref:Glycogen synthase n=1 Tax=Mycobacteroides salmoniphilum TaxID=404941 RepID=A0A4R8T0J0_9MYCO|nr:glycosyltransferase family 4 protein [Mycobacteroides salmoniphilum]TEA09766.1 Glycogen synthase [Mycobacteroides salmoniphilum]
MRILMVSWEYPPVVIGGLGRHVHHLSTELAAAGHEVVVLTRRPSGTDPASHPTSDEISEGVRVVAAAEDPHDFDFGTDMMAWTLAMGHAMVRAGLALGFKGSGDWRPDVVHAHDWLVAHPAIALAEHFDVPLVSTLHATEAGRHGGWVSGRISRQVHSVEWWLARESDSLITCSASMLDEVTQLFGPELPQVHVIRNGIDVTRWVFAPRLPADGSAPVLLFVGRLEYEKGIHDAIAALPKIRRSHPGTVLAVAGDGTQQDWLLEQARKHKVVKSVQFLGNLDHEGLLQWLHRADAILLPSHYEPFGIVALEAAAAGTPLVTSTVGGLGEAVIDGETGLSFTPRDVAGIADAVKRTLDDPAAAAERAVAARARLTADFDWATVADETAQVYLAAKRREREPLGRSVIVERPLPDR